jgi:hypothetical protein
MLKDCNKRDYDIGLHALHGWSRFMWPDCIDSKGAILKIDTPTNIISNYDKTIYNVRTRNTHQLIQDLKEYPSQYSVYAFGEYIHYIDKM